ncbi:hypothetical protein CAI21_09645 [Alkalilimnicola ehrlichii]|uniref:Uncharacterized protein n=1 Tax=Alkalilimnicola ehrlichii TaxID=351052 RepID=A0A3E0WXF1_9GAMM|nr:hypothetical protein [Alkalilimnicola ehrlichii]RFA29326.1 hypothetical protein CAI21_09645 [Alkalilimnicola ehrlichii]RFA36841.1 hypothetical protein CAL65_09980 [Alkalilimnicola ehrlichii]
MYTRKAIEIAQKMRRHIRSEFGEQIPLATPDLVERLFAYVPRSRTAVLARLAAELEKETASAQSTAEPLKQENVTYYRGAALSPSAPSKPQDTSGPTLTTDTAASKPRRIYRGQIIE